MILISHTSCTDQMRSLQVQQQLSIASRSLHVPRWLAPMGEVTVMRLMILPPGRSSRMAGLCLQPKTVDVQHRGPPIICLMKSLVACIITARVQ